MKIAPKLLLVACLSAAVAASSFSISDALASKYPQHERITRELPWDGSDALILGAPAKVRFIQAPGPGVVSVTGHRRSVETFNISNGVLNDRTAHTGEPLEVVVTAPNVTRFSAKGGDQ